MIFAARNKKTGTNRPRLTVGGGTGQYGIRGTVGHTPFRGVSHVSHYPGCTDPVTPSREAQKTKTKNKTTKVETMPRFFLNMIPPTATAQQKQFTRTRSGKIIARDADQLAAARSEIMAHMPSASAPLTGPVNVCVKFIWPLRKADKPGTYWRATRPDADNAVKLVLDCMTRHGYWNDDSQVASLTVQKFRSDTPAGIFVEYFALHDSLDLRE